MLAQIGKNKFKTMLIVGLIFAFVAVVVYFASSALGMGNLSLPLAFGTTFVTTFISYYSSDKIILKISGARPADPETDKKVQNIMEGLVIASGIPMPKVYIINDPSPNAFATGRNPKNGVVAVTTGLLATMDYYQLEGVLAHELAHIKNYDILLQTIVTVMVGAAVMLADMWRRSMMFGGGRNRNSNNKNGSGQAVMLIVGIVLVVLAPIAGQLMKMALSRNREYLADATAVEMTRNPEGLAGALERLRGAPPVANATNATAGLYISNPLKQKAGNTEKTSLFATHPPIAKRVEAIRGIR